MKTATLLTTAGLFTLSVFAGAGSAQPPSAPPPREKTAAIEGLGTRTVGPEPKEELPEVEMTTEDGKFRVIIQWKGRGTSWTYRCTRAVIRDGVLTLTGLAEDGYVLILDRTLVGQVLHPIVIGPDTRLQITLRDGRSSYNNPNQKCPIEDQLRPELRPKGVRLLP